MTKLLIAAAILLTSASASIADDASERIALARQLIPGLRPGFNTSPWTPPGVPMLPPGAPSAAAWMWEHSPPVPVIAVERKQNGSK